MKWSWILIFGIFFSCHQNDQVADSIEFIEDTVPSVIKFDSTLLIQVEQAMREIGLIDLLLVDSTIQIDLKYATTNNFMATQLYDTLSRLFLQKDVAIRLSKSQKFLDSIHPGYSLLVYDGARPRAVQQEMWDALDSIPIYRRGKYVSNPRNGSVHNFGAAVDLTIVDSFGIELDMGAGYDDFREIASPKNEARFLKSGELTSDQYNNRKLLRRVMRYSKFYNIPSEWWHFNACSRISASHRYQLLLSESGSSIWFKIPFKRDSISGSEINPGQDSTTLF
ncbi:MAG: M15 family metallopeptidase [Crocinitomicaceae bacterium]|nr:M15 family metallopeptidase [Crocinitomicaceae bacterium]